VRRAVPAAAAGGGLPRGLESASAGGWQRAQLACRLLNALGPLAPLPSLPGPADSTWEEFLERLEAGAALAEAAGGKGLAGIRDSFRCGPTAMLGALPGRTRRLGHGILSTPRSPIRAPAKPHHTPTSTPNPPLPPPSPQARLLRGGRRRRCAHPTSHLSQPPTPRRPPPQGASSMRRPLVPLRPPNLTFPSPLPPQGASFLRRPSAARASRWRRPSAARAARATTTRPSCATRGGCTTTPPGKSLRRPFRGSRNLRRCGAGGVVLGGRGVGCTVQ
jgi:hypothetical protein